VGAISRGFIMYNIFPLSPLENLYVLGSLDKFSRFSGRACKYSWID
jgi:hypothetical protein